MKMFAIIASLLFVVQAYACPDLTGAFYNSEDDMVMTISQQACEATTWSDDEGKTTLLADGVERVLQQEKDMIAYATVYFTAEELVIDIRMDWGKYTELDLPARWFTAYRIDKFNNLVERIIPFKADGTQLATDYITFRRVK